jgi:hypothetical protein
MLNEKLFDGRAKLLNRGAQVTSLRLQVAVDMVGQNISSAETHG